MSLLRAGSGRAWRRTAGLLAALAACGTHAGDGTACPEPVVRSLQARLAAQAGQPASSAPDRAPTAQACRVWPHDRDILLAAIAQPAAGPDGNVDRQHLLVAMLSADDASVLATHTAHLQEDAGFELSAGGLRLDTARYQLSPTVRAFGLVVVNSARGPSCPDAWSTDELTLLVRDGDVLRPVLSMPLRTWERVEGEPCAAAIHGGFIDQAARLSIGVEPAAGDGYADLRVMADVERRIETWSADGLEDSTVVRSRRSVVLRHDGVRYDAGPLRHGYFWSDTRWREDDGD